MKLEGNIIDNFYEVASCGQSKTLRNLSDSDFENFLKKIGVEFEEEGSEWDAESRENTLKYIEKMNKGILNAIFSESKE
jgi:hypothetical protein